MTVGIRNMVAVAVLLALAAAGGCASETKGQKTLAGYSETKTALIESQQAVNDTLIALNSIRSRGGSGLSKAFEQYKSTIDQLQKQAADAKRVAGMLKENTDSNIQAWQQEMGSIKDPTIKASLESRRDAVRSNYKLVQMYAQDVRKAYDPFLQTNKELIKALSIDLSPAGVDSLAPAMDRAGDQGQTLVEKISAMRHALDNMAQGLSPIGQ